LGEVALLTINEEFENVGYLLWISMLTVSSSNPLKSINPT